MKRFQFSLRTLFILALASAMCFWWWKAGEEPPVRTASESYLDFRILEDTTGLELIKISSEEEYRKEYEKEIPFVHYFRDPPGFPMYFNDKFSIDWGYRPIEKAACQKVKNTNHLWEQRSLPEYYNGMHKDYS